MIALQAMLPDPHEHRHERRVERGRIATRRRVRLAQRRASVALLRVGGCAAAIVVPLMLYVMLTANLTSMNYALAHAQTEKAALLALTMRQDDRIARLESRGRLAAIAARLNMHDPQAYAVVTLPAPSVAPPAATGVAMLGAVGRWLDTAVTGAGR